MRIEFSHTHVTGKIKWSSHMAFALLWIVCALFIASCSNTPSIVERDDLRGHYDHYHVDGSFALYDVTHNKLVVYNRPHYTTMYSPASTFKICNSLIGLETGVISGDSYVITWDSVNRNPVWDRDHDLRSAFANSTVWYYQELARRVGGARMKHWIDAANYGNRDTSGGLDSFWLSGGLRISPQQQIEFLIGLRNGTLPFSRRSLDIVRDIMIVHDSTDYTMRAKTGWGGQDGKEIGWYVGYLETPDNAYVFSNIIFAESHKLTEIDRAIEFDVARTAIVSSILDSLGIVRGR